MMPTLKSEQLKVKDTHAFKCLSLGNAYSTPEVH